MARGEGLFGRIAKGLGRLAEGLGNWFGEGEPSPPPRAPPPPPTPPAPPPEPPALTRENKIWREVAKGPDKRDTGTMADWFELYQNAVDPLDMDEGEFFQFWREFLRAFYLTSGERGSIKRDTFYRRIGVRKRDFGMDWQEWRELKRGTP